MNDCYHSFPAIVNYRHPESIGTIFSHSLRSRGNTEPESGWNLGIRVGFAKVIRQGKTELSQSLGSLGAREAKGRCKAITLLHSCQAKPDVSNGLDHSL